MTKLINTMVVSTVDEAFRAALVPERGASNAKIKWADMIRDEILDFMRTHPLETQRALEQ